MQYLPTTSCIALHRTRVFFAKVFALEPKASKFAIFLEYDNSFLVFYLLVFHIRIILCFSIKNALVYEKIKLHQFETRKKTRWVFVFLTFPGGKNFSKSPFFLRSDCTDCYSYGMERFLGHLKGFLKGFCISQFSVYVNSRFYSRTNVNREIRKYYIDIHTTFLGIFFFALSKFFYPTHPFYMLVWQYWKSIVLNKVE